MAILNYTTTIDVHKTLGEIQKCLVQHGAKQLLYNYNDNGQITSLCFKINTLHGEVSIKLPANIDAVYKVLQEQRKKGKIKINIDYDQATRVAWRIIKDWILAQMAILETNMVKTEEVFLPYISNKMWAQSDYYIDKDFKTIETTKQYFEDKAKEI